MRWTEPMIAELQRRYPYETAKSIAKGMGITASQAQQKAYALGFEKSKTRTTSNGALVVNGRVQRHKMR